MLSSKVMMLFKFKTLNKTIFTVKSENVRLTLNQMKRKFYTCTAGDKQNYFTNVQYMLNVPHENHCSVVNTTCKISIAIEGKILYFFPC